MLAASNPTGTINPLPEDNMQQVASLNRSSVQASRRFAGEVFAVMQTYASQFQHSGQTMPASLTLPAQVTQIDVNAALHGSASALAAQIVQQAKQSASLTMPTQHFLNYMNTRGVSATAMTAA